MRLIVAILTFILLTMSVSADTWTLKETRTNPAGAMTDFEGGVTPGYYNERNIGKYDRYDVQESSITISTKDVYREVVNWEAVYKASFDAMPQELESKDVVQLKATISGSGAGYEGFADSCSAAMRFEYRADGVSLDGETQYTICLDMKSGEVTPTFTVPEKGPDEIVIKAFAWNCAACLVEWVYEKAEPEYGVIEKDGKLYINSPPGEVLEISMSDLPEWARASMVTVGAVIINVGPPDSVSTGDENVLLDGLPVARLHDETTHGGNIVEGSDKIFINGKPAAFRGGFAACPLVTNMVPHIGGPIAVNCEQVIATASTDTDMQTLNDCLDSLVPSELRPKIDDEGGFTDEDYFCWDMERRIRTPGMGAFTNVGMDLCELSKDIRRTNKRMRKGENKVDVWSDGFEVGDGVVIGNSPEKSEVAKVTGFGSLILDRPLKFDHPQGTLVVKIPAEYVEDIPEPGIAHVDIGAISTDDTSTNDIRTEETPSESSGTLIFSIILMTVLVVGYWMYKKK